MVSNLKELQKLQKGETPLFKSKKGAIERITELNLRMEQDEREVDCG
jgi:hypothetical protein